MCMLARVYTWKFCHNMFQLFIKLKYTTSDKQYFLHNSVDSVGGSSASRCQLWCWDDCSHLQSAGAGMTEMLDIDSSE